MQQGVIFTTPTILLIDVKVSDVKATDPIPSACSYVKSQAVRAFSGISNWAITDN
jgi:hypothetical protein